jgi:hypothetical protein
VESLFDEAFVAELATDIHHAHVEEVVSIAEVSEVDEITFLADKDGVGELEVSVDGSVLVWNAADETAQFIFFVCREKRVFM